MAPKGTSVLANAPLACRATCIEEDKRYQGEGMGERNISGTYFFSRELGHELIQTHMAQKPMLRVEVGASRFAHQMTTKYSYLSEISPLEPTHANPTALSNTPTPLGLMALLGASFCQAYRP